MERIITESFARLMGRGTHRGFITYDELSKSLGKRNLSDDNLAQAFIHILDEKVSLVEKKSKNEHEVIELLDDISRDLNNYDLEFRIQELESKFSKDLSQTTFNELKELKKKQNLN